MISTPFNNMLLRSAVVVLALFSLPVIAFGQVPGRPRTAPTSTPTPTPSPIVRPGQSLEQLQTTIRQRLFSPDVRRGRVGLKIVSLATGKVIAENDSERYFMPASNMKNFTVAAGFEKLGADFRFVTSVFADSLPDATGTIRGDLRIFGRGDISISTAFNNGDYYRGIDMLVERISAAGVKRIDGGIVGDESYFRGHAIPETWEWDDLQWYYGAEISALPLNDNSVDLRVSPGSSGQPCVVTVSPANKLMQVVNSCTTAGSTSTLRIFKHVDRNIVEVSGSLPRGDNGFSGSITFSHPADLFLSLLKERLEARGIVVTGMTRTLPPVNPSPTGQVEIARLESPPYSVIAGRTMKPSQNMYTETILWTLGEQVGRKNGQSGNSAQLGLNVVRSFLTEIGVPADGINQYDGSGLSRHNLVTPAAIVSLYSYMGKQSRNSQAWRDSLTIAGIDGTLKNRFAGSAAVGNMRGKTGTIDQVSALSGYVTTAGGEQLVLSIIVNGVAEPRKRTSLIDDIVVELAKFDGRID